MFMSEALARHQTAYIVESFIGPRDVQGAALAYPPIHVHHVHLVAKLSDLRFHNAGHVRYPTATRMPGRLQRRRPCLPCASRHFSPCAHADPAASRGIAASRPAHAPPRSATLAYPGVNSLGAGCAEPVREQCLRDASLHHPREARRVDAAERRQVRRGTTRYAPLGVERHGRAPARTAAASSPLMRSGCRAFAGHGRHINVSIDVDGELNDARVATSASATR